MARLCSKGGIWARYGVRVALAAALSLALLPLATPAASGAADDDIPGVAIPASPFNGVLDYDTDYDDVYRVYMNPNQSLTVTFRGPANANFDLYLFPPGTPRLDSVYRYDDSLYWGSVERFTYVKPPLPPSGGEYYVDVYSAKGSGNYTLAWRVENEVPGLAVYPIEGIGRIETAIDASREVFVGGADTVLIATARDFPDALGGGALAGILGAPILLTEPTALPASVATEIVDNLGAKRVIILGGSGAVSQGVENTLRSLYGVVEVQRIQGVSRYETAENVANRVLEELQALPQPPAKHTALITTGEAFPDAVAASSLASWGGFPFFLVRPGVDPADFAATLTDAGIDEVAILGGVGAVSAEVEAAIDEAGIVIIGRFAGIDRYETAALIADTFAYSLEVLQEEGAGGGAMEFALTTGADFPDALAGGAALGQYSTPILLTRPMALDPSAAAVLDYYGPEIENLDFLGGLGSVNIATRMATRNVIRDSWTTGLSMTSVSPMAADSRNVFAPNVSLSSEAPARPER